MRTFLRHCTRITHGRPIISRIVQSTRFYSTPPPSYFENGSNLPRTFDQMKNKKDDRSKSTQSDTLRNDRSSASDSSYFKMKDLSKTIAYLGVSGALIFILLEQRRKLDLYKKQLLLVKRNQKEIVVQTQNYKKKMTANTVSNTRHHTLIEGKMQMHIALLRKQLKDNGQEPVSIDKAIEEFDDKVRMMTTTTEVALWIPGDTQIKALIPDANEYSSRD